jgi:hypothetical protein
MAWTRWRDRDRVRRTAIVDAYQFPGSVRQRFAQQREGLSSDQLRRVEAGARQWFRLAAGHPKVRLWMPSVVVDQLWHEFVLHTRDYAAFCDAAFGRFVHHVPDPAVTTTDAAQDRDSALLATFRLAQQDEGCPPNQLPLLFRIDQQLAVPGGRHYLAHCGGRDECLETPGTLCLQHLQGFAPPRRGYWNPDRWLDKDMPAPGGGCGG